MSTEECHLKGLLYSTSKVRKRKCDLSTSNFKTKTYFKFKFIKEMFCIRTRNRLTVIGRTFKLQIGHHFMIKYYVRNKL